MNQSTKRVLFFVMAVILLLTACAPAAATAPTQDPALVQQVIQQSVALTVAAQNAQTLEAQALVVASNTPLATQTDAAAPSATPLIPTATPFVIVPATQVPVVSGGGGGTTTKPDYACDVIHQRPYDDTIFKPNDTFDVKWTIVNTGTKTWRKGLDLKYLSGPKMTSTGNIELPEMKPGDQFNVVLDGTAPTDKGTKVMVWVLEGPICYPYVRIIVDK
jgi:Ig-like domain from next to BRCA1 gene